MIRSLVPALIGAAAAATPVLGQTSAAELERDVESMRAQLQRLEQRLEEQRQVEQTRLQILDDADRRSQLLATDDATAGYDRGFFIRGGNFELRPGIQFQFRNITNVRTDDDDDIQNGFEVRRLRFRFDGYAISKDLTYSFVWDTNRSGGGVSLLDALVQYQFADEWALKAGQFRESISHEKDVSAFRQLAVDRSIVDTYIGGAQIDRVQGLALVYGSKENPLRAEVAFHDGANSRNTNFLDTAAGNFGFGGRVEYLASGEWSAYRDFSAKGTKEDLLVFGAGIDWTQAGEVDVYRPAVDVQWENTSGLGVYAAVLAQHVDFDGGDSTDYGGLVQVGYLLNPKWEVFGRYAIVLFDDDFVHNDTINEFVIGVNYFFGEDGKVFHNGKITIDFVYLPDGLPSDQTGLGYLASDNAEFVLRTQFTFAI